MSDKVRFRPCYRAGAGAVKRHSGPDKFHELFGWNTFYETHFTHFLAVKTLKIFGKERL
jgi:hypothetical protein